MFGAFSWPLGRETARSNPGALLFQAQKLPRRTSAVAESKTQHLTDREELFYSRAAEANPFRPVAISQEAGATGAAAESSLAKEAAAAEIPVRSLSAPSLQISVTGISARFSRLGMGLQLGRRRPGDELDLLTVLLTIPQTDRLKKGF